MRRQLRSRVCPRAPQSVSIPDENQHPERVDVPPHLEPAVDAAHVRQQFLALQFEDPERDDDRLPLQGHEQCRQVVALRALDPEHLLRGHRAASRIWSAKPAHSDWTYLKSRYTGGLP